VTFCAGQDDSDFEEQDSEEETSNETLHGKDCVCGKQATDHAYPWIITPAGFKLYKKWMVEEAKRD
jgi:hypothetical protein